MNAVRTSTNKKNIYSIFNTKVLSASGGAGGGGGGGGVKKTGAGVGVGGDDVANSKEIYKQEDNEDKLKKKCVVPSIELDCCDSIFSFLLAEKKTYQSLTASCTGRFGLTAFNSGWMSWSVLFWL